MIYPIYELVFFLIIYSFIGWLIETIVYTSQRKRLGHVGFITLPLILTYGIVMLLLVQLLPSFGSDYLGMYVLTLLLSAIIEAFMNFSISMVFRGTQIKSPRRRDLFGGSIKGAVAALIMAGVYLLLYLFIQPLLVLLVNVIPDIIVIIIVCVVMLVIVIDLVVCVISVRRGDYEGRQDKSQGKRISVGIYRGVWKRLQKNYPGSENMAPEEERETYTFAEGLNFDKLFWIMIIFGFFGCIIEFFYVGFVDGMWGSRASTLYLPISIVWGGGAALITLALLPLSKRNDRWVFVGGFFLGGAYEYSCSVLTELMFGRVFWDYSHLPFNIGGRTHLLFCFFWGIVGVVWIKIGYPFLSRIIEKIPPVAGKVITWTLILAILLDSAITIMAITRYNDRQNKVFTGSGYERYLDTLYPDELIENHWKNMVKSS